MRKWEDLRGDRDAIRARLESVMNAGAKSVLFIAPPASGVTMLALRVPCLLDEPTAEERSVIRLTHESYRAQMGQLPPALPQDGRPWRAPHHTVSRAALYENRWSEFRLAGGGTLYLDSASEFNPESLKRVLQVAGTDPLGPRLVLGSLYTPRRETPRTTHESVLKAIGDEHFERCKQRLIDQFDATVYLDSTNGMGGLTVAGLGTPERGAL